jgi:secreted trypsin-like serine protease
MVAAMLRALLASSALVLLLAAPAFAVFGGKTIGDGDPIARSVAAVLYRDTTGAHLCTAVVLSPRLILTAAHCTAGDRSDMKVIFSTGLSGVSGERLRGAAAVVRAGATPEAKGSYAYNNPDDIALVLLDSAAPPDATPAHLAAAPSGSVVHIAGYGATSDLRHGNLFGKQQLGFGQGLRAATATLKLKGAIFAANQSGSAGMCTGDSGGPAFVAGKNGVSVIGLLIGVSAPRDAADYCRGTAWFTSIPRWSGWIRTTAKSLGAPLP